MKIITKIMTMKLVKKIFIQNIKLFAVIICFIITSFSAGILFKLYNDECEWNCKDEPMFYTIFSSILIGVPVLIMCAVFITIGFVIIGSCVIACLQIGTNNI